MLSHSVTPNTAAQECQLPLKPLLHPPTSPRHPLLQPPRQQEPIPDRNPQPHQIRQRTNPMHATKRPIQPLHLLRLRSLLIVILPIPRLLMLPLLHNPRRDRTCPEQIRRIQRENRRQGRQDGPPVPFL